MMRRTPTQSGMRHVGPRGEFEIILRWLKTHPEPPAPGLVGVSLSTIYALEGHLAQTRAASPADHDKIIVVLSPGASVDVSRAAQALEIPYEWGGSPP